MWGDIMHLVCQMPLDFWGGRHGTRLILHKAFFLEKRQLLTAL